MQELRALVASLAPVPPEDLDGLEPSTRLVGDLGYDSLALIELTTALVEQYGVPEATAVDVLTVGEVEALVGAAHL